MHAVAEAARNVACAGATPVAATNCLNFGNPEKPEIMWQFAQVVEGMAKACLALGTPVTGGNVSFYNETLGEGIYPTPVVGVVGVVDQIDRATTIHFRQPGRAVLLLSASEPGDSVDAEAEFGSSSYAQEVLGVLWGFPPALELGREAALQKCLLELIAAGLVESAHDCADGGIAVTLAECAFGLGVGAEIRLAGRGLPSKVVLFAEDASRVLVSCDRNNLQAIKGVALKYKVAADEVGQTIPDNLRIAIDGKTAVFAAVSELRRGWDSSLEGALHAETREHLVPETLQKS
jgi:phosphoribosylformylglycinamidine synthase